jgi:hypothetical protein
MCTPALVVRPLTPVHFARRVEGPLWGALGRRTFTQPVLTGCQLRKRNRKTTFNNGSLGSRIDEERSEMR